DRAMDAWRGGWAAHLGPALPPEAWLVGDASAGQGGGDAPAAIESRPPLEELPGHDFPALVGPVSLPPGRVAPAAPALEEASRSCRVLDDPFAALHATYDLAVAREAAGDVPAACDAYARVVSRWGTATPRSVTADQARAARRRLRCQ